MKRAMKRVLSLTGCSLAVALWSVSGFAGGVAVLDMQQLLQNSKQVKQINESLEKKFAVQKQEVDALGKDLQKDIDNYKKNQAVMDKKADEAMKDKIRDKEQKLQQKQTDLQRQLFEAQNKEMTHLLDDIKGISKNVATTKNYDVVLPKNALLYSKDDLDITPTVLTELNKKA